MSVFKKILNKLGFGKEDESKETKSSTSTPEVKSTRTPMRSAGGSGASRSRSKEMPMVDVVAKLEGLAAANSQKLNWKVSIVDMLKLLDLESSLDARKELAVELNCPEHDMADSARMNSWLHKTVLQKLADNGGNVPQDLLN